MPYDIGANYKMKYHSVPTYLNSACLPFCQEFFSMPSYDHLRYSNYEHGLHNPVKTYVSALQGEEQKQMMINLAQKLAIWHSIDK